MLTLVIAPFFISFLLRTLAWKQILSDEAPVVTALKAVAILPPDAHITGTPFAVIFGLTYNFIPFMTLPIYTTLERLDTRYLEAGSDLYASPATTFLQGHAPAVDARHRLGNAAHLHPGGGRLHQREPRTSSASTDTR